MKPKEADVLSQLAGCYYRRGSHDRYPWQPMPWPGVHNKVLFFERCTGATIELARVEKGAEFPEHYHTTMQTQFLVSGRIRGKSGLIREAGNFDLIPAGQLHGPFFAEEEAITFKYFSSVPVYILPGGDMFVYREDGRVLAAGKVQASTLLEGRENFISG